MLADRGGNGGHRFVLSQGGGIEGDIVSDGAVVDGTAATWGAPLHLRRRFGDGAGQGEMHGPCPHTVCLDGAAVLTVC